jgi:hypothetical protein
MATSVAEDKIPTDIPRVSMIAKLKRNICLIRFTKANGEIREMKCTLSEKLIGKPINGTPGGENKEVVQAYDLEKKNYRSFRMDSLRKGCKILEAA